MNEELNRIRAAASQDLNAEPLTLKYIAHALQRQDQRLTNQPQYQLWETRNMVTQLVDQFFTYSAASRYAQLNSHNLGKTFVCVASGWRNEEWQLIRQLLIQLFPLNEDE